MDDLPERVKVLEVKVMGNGSPGLMQRMQKAETELYSQRDMMACYDKNTLNFVSALDIRRIVREEIKSGEKGFLKYMGAILTGLAALILAIAQFL